MAANDRPLTLDERKRELTVLKAKDPAAYRVARREFNKEFYGTNIPTADQKAALEAASQSAKRQAAGVAAGYVPASAKPQLTPEEQKKARMDFYARVQGRVNPTTPADQGATTTWDVDKNGIPDSLQRNPVAPAAPPATATATPATVGMIDGEPAGKTLSEMRDKAKKAFKAKQGPEPFSPSASERAWQAANTLKAKAEEDRKRREAATQPYGASSPQDMPSQIAMDRAAIAGALERSKAQRAKSEAAISPRAVGQGPTITPDQSIPASSGSPQKSAVGPLASPTPAQTSPQPAPVKPVAQSSVPLPAQLPPAPTKGFTTPMKSLWAGRDPSAARQQLLAEGYTDKQAEELMAMAGVTEKAFAEKLRKKEEERAAKEAEKNAEPPELRAMLEKIRSKPENQPAKATGMFQGTLAGKTYEWLSENLGAGGRRTIEEQQARSLFRNKKPQ